MQDLKTVYERIKEKKRRCREIVRSFRDQLAQSAGYKEVVDQLASLREKKKSIENAVCSSAAADAEKLDLLKLEVKNEEQMLSDIALSMYAGGQTVDVKDEDSGEELVPKFTCKLVRK